MLFVFAMLGPDPSNPYDLLYGGSRLQSSILEYFCHLACPCTVRSLGVLGAEWPTFCFHWRIFFADPITSGDLAGEDNWVLIFACVHVSPGPRQCWAGAAAKWYEGDCGRWIGIRDCVNKWVGDGVCLYDCVWWLLQFFIVRAKVVRAWRDSEACE